jgi:hypothetical protein
MTTPVTPIPAEILASKFPTNADRTAGAFNVKAIAWANSENAMVTRTREIAEAARRNALTANTAASEANADARFATIAAAAVAAANPVSNAAAASASAAAAAVSAGIAQAVSPDSPVRFNSRKISDNLVIGSNYNAASAGPITISDGVTVTVQDNATWVIH